MTFQTITYSVDREVATIRLNRPQRYNSFTDEMHSEMRSALKKVSADSKLRCLVITGNGRGANIFIL